MVLIEIAWLINCQTVRDALKVVLMASLLDEPTMDKFNVDGPVNKWYQLHVFPVLDLDPSAVPRNSGDHIVPSSSSQIEVLGGGDMVLNVGTYVQRTRSGWNSNPVGDSTHTIVLGPRGWNFHMGDRRGLGGGTGLLRTTRIIVIVRPASRSAASVGTRHPLVLGLVGWSGYE
jgi:hypothetical protein